MIQLNEIHFGYDGRMLMEGLSLHVRPGDRIGIVGPNGAGKTTLLRIIEGEIGSYSGTISRRKGIVTGCLPQDGIYEKGRSVYDAALAAFDDLIEIEDKIEKLNRKIAAGEDETAGDAFLERVGNLQMEYETRGGFTFRTETARVLTGLGFTESDFERDMSEFSGGWQMRVALARLLLRDPEILMLDEPTNHLDLPAIIWFENFLQTFDGAVIIISHDQYFLDKVVRRIAEFTQKKLELYDGNYSYYEVEKVKRLEILKNRFANQAREIRSTERFIERFRYKATKARQVQSRIKMLEKIDRIELPGAERNLSFKFKAREKSGKVVLQLKDVGKSYGDHEVLKGINITVNRGDRVGIIGANGLGKTTLMRVMAGRTDFEGVRKLGHKVSFSYFSQDQYELLSPDNTVLCEAQRSCGAGFDGNIRGILGVFLFSGDDVEKKVCMLSGGEKSRLLFAKMMANPANLLLLDEPTNHLDPQSRRMLEDVFLNYDGTICFVSHDRYFINNLATRIIEIVPGGYEEYIGNYEDYKEQKKLREQAAEEGRARDDDESNKNGDKTLSRKDVRRERAKFVAERAKALNPIRNRIAGIEEEIALLEDSAGTIESELADPATYNDQEKTKSLPGKLKHINNKLESLYDEWEMRSNELAGLEKDFDRKEFPGL